MRKCAPLVAIAILLAGATLAAPSAVKAAATGGSVFRGEIWDQSCAKRGSHDVMAKEAGIHRGPQMARKCTLLCHQMGSPLVLYSPSTKRISNLDDQKKAVPFAGEKVEITGTLDARTDAIHIEKITAAH